LYDPARAIMEKEVATMRINPITDAQSAYSPARLRAATFRVGTYVAAPVGGGIGGEVCPQAASMWLTVGQAMPTQQDTHLIQNVADSGLVASTGDVRFVKVPPGSHARRRTG
jgi:hypothetical protein